MRFHLIKAFCYAVVMPSLVFGLTGCAATSQQTTTGKQARHGPVKLGYSVSDTPSLTQMEVKRILQQGVQAARNETSLLRVNEDGKKEHARMHIFVVNRKGAVIGRRSMPGAWVGSVSIAKGKAFTALAFSSNENALTSRTIGQLSQPGGPLWQIGNSNRKPGLIEFPGGVPLYKDRQLVGAVGVSGDGVEQDENVAQAAADGFAAPKAIRVNSVTGGSVPYTK